VKINKESRRKNNTAGAACFENSTAEGTGGGKKIKEGRVEKKERVSKNNGVLAWERVEGGKGSSFPKKKK